MKPKPTPSISNTFSRRTFLHSSSGSAIALGMWSGRHALAQMDEWNPHRPFQDAWGVPLRIQPILMYKVAVPQKQRSWRSWGDVLTEAKAEEELQRIGDEWIELKTKAGVPLEILEPQKVKTEDEADRALQGDFDLTVIYPASGSGKLLQRCASHPGDTLIFLRHRSGHIYYWYEALSVAYLQTDREEQRTGEPPRLPGVHVDDVVVDDYDEMAWRLRSLYAVKNLQNTRIVALGGAWGKYAADAPQIAHDKYGIDIIDVGYDEIEPRIKKALADREVMRRAEQRTDMFLNLPNTELTVPKPFVVNAFVLYELFKELMQENQATVFTIKDCMSTIIPMAETTACLTLGLINDEGAAAFCESDFVVIPAGILLRHIAGTPVFLHNSTFPHNGMVTCAHCAAPRRMNADRYEPVKILTHEESDYGAAPKVEIPIGQEVTFIDPEYTKGRWLGFLGEVEANPSYAICRSQQDVRIMSEEWEKLKHEARDSHWLMCYGDHLKSIGYAARKLQVDWEPIV